MNPMTAEMRRCHDNCHQKIDSASDEQSGTKGDEHLPVPHWLRCAKLEKWPQHQLEEVLAAMGYGRRRLVSKRQYRWRRTKAVIKSHRQGSDYHCGKGWDANVAIEMESSCLLFGYFYAGTSQPTSLANDNCRNQR
jgi:hypothetical protein